MKPKVPFYNIIMCLSNKSILEYVKSEPKSMNFNIEGHSSAQESPLRKKYKFVPIRLARILI